MIGGPINQVAAAAVATSESLGVSSYTDLTTPGPAVTIVVPASGIVKVSLSVTSSGSATNTQQRMSVALSGGNTVAASDNYACTDYTGIINNLTTKSIVFGITGLAAGSTTFTCKYSSTTGTSTFQNRWIVVEGLP